MTDDTQRARYESDLAVSWPAVPLALILAAAAALGCGYAMNLLYNQGIYLVILVSVLAAFAMGGVIRGLVVMTGCRFHPLDAGPKLQLWMVRLMIRREAGFQELLLSVGHVNWTPRTNSGREKMARQVCDQIDRLRGLTGASPHGN